MCSIKASIAGDQRLETSDHNPTLCTAPRLADKRRACHKYVFASSEGLWANRQTGNHWGNNVRHILVAAKDLRFTCFGGGEGFCVLVVLVAAKDLRFTCFGGG